jgi:hypothetical protein
MSRKVKVISLSPSGPKGGLEPSQTVDVEATLKGGRGRAATPADDRGAG